MTVHLTSGHYCTCRHLTEHLFLGPILRAVSSGGGSSAVGVWQFSYCDLIFSAGRVRPTSAAAAADRSAGLSFSFPEISYWYLSGGPDSGRAARGLQETGA